MSETATLEAPASAPTHYVALQNMGGNVPTGERDEDGKLRKDTAGRPLATYHNWPRGSVVPAGHLLELPRLIADKAVRAATPEESGLERVDLPVVEREQTLAGKVSGLQNEVNYLRAELRKATDELQVAQVRLGSQAFAAPTADTSESVREMLAARDRRIAELEAQLRNVEQRPVAQPAPASLPQAQQPNQPPRRK